MQHLIKYVKCPQCGREAVVDTSAVLTSIPPKYNYYCKCGQSGYCFRDEIYYRYKEVLEENADR